MVNSNETGQWWKGFFDLEYAKWGLTPPRGQQGSEHLSREVEGLIRILDIPAGARVFDQCCGVGRMSGPIAELGYDVLGWDVIPDYAEATRTLLGSRGQAVCADAFEYIASPKCQAGFNWFTSFGYVDDDTENLKMLKCARESLESGGVFVLDYSSTPRVFQNFKPSHAVGREDGTWIIQETDVNWTSGMFRTRWTILSADGKRTVKESTNRTYQPHELLGLFDQAGFADVELLGGVEGQPFGFDSPRMLIRGRA